MRYPPRHWVHTLGGVATPTANIRIAQGTCMHRLLIAAMATALSACGGGSSEDAGSRLVCATCPVDSGTSGSGGGETTAPPVTTAGSVEGYWEGSAGAYTFGTVILGDGTAYVVYTRSGTIEGLMFGSVSTSGASFSGALTDYNARLLSVTSGTIAGAYGTKNYLSGTAAVGSLSYQIAATYNTIYDTEADLAEFAGSWTGTAGSADGVSRVTLQIAADGRITASTDYCNAIGTATPAKAGKHPLRITISFSGLACPLAGREVSGVAIVSQAGARKQLVAAGLLPDRSDGFFAVASR